MSTELRRRRGTTVQHASFTGAPGEITVDTTGNNAVVHDGVTPGGHPVPTKAYVDAGLAYRGGVAYLSASQSIPDSVSTQLSFDSEQIDTDNIFDAGSPGLLTVPSGVSLVRFSASCRFGVNSTGRRVLRLTDDVGGSVSFYPFNNEDADTNLDVGNIMSFYSIPLSVTPSSSFTVTVFQTSGGALDVLAESYFEMEILE